MNTGPIYNTIGFFGRAFPAPTYLSMPAVGIDISDYAIKYISLKRNKGVAELHAHGKVDLPVEVIERGAIKDPQTMIKLLSRIQEEYSFEFAHIALPEEHAYLFQTDVAKGDKDDVEEKLRSHLKENVPIGADEALFDYNIINETEETYKLNVSVYPANIAVQYVDVLEEAGFKLLSIEIEGQATARTLLGSSDSAPTLIVDIGRNNASLAIAKNSEVIFTANLETGGDYFTRAIARNLDISFQEAEKLKQKHGFRDTPEDKIVFDCLLPVLEKFAESIQKHHMYWQMHMSSGGESKEGASKVVLVGGNANIVGLAEYLEAALEVPVEIGDVWKNIFSYETYIPDVHAKKSLEYTTAVGAALRSLLRDS
jgi:type IV pilus assembly protein PilM